MSRILCMVLLLAGSLPPAWADHARVLVDGQRLGSLPVEAGFLLPDGTYLFYQTLYEACRDHQAAGDLYFRPDTSECHPLIEVSPPDLPERIELGDGVVVFNQLTRETCLPGKCVVTVGGVPAGGGPGPGPVDPADPIFSDGFELLIPQT